jgi:hypothetical protein
LVERIRITSSNITTKDASGNITFSTDRQYLKTDATGILKAGGYQSVPTPAGYLNVIANSDKGWYCPGIVNLTYINSSTYYYYPLTRFSQIAAGSDYDFHQYGGLNSNTYNPTQANPSYSVEGFPYFHSPTISLTTSFGETIGSYNWSVYFLYQSYSQGREFLNQDGYYETEPDIPEALTLKGLQISNLSITNWNFGGIPKFTFSDPGNWYSNTYGVNMSYYSYLYGSTPYLELKNHFILIKNDPVSLSLKVTP